MHQEVERCISGPQHLTTASSSTLLHVPLSFSLDAGIHSAGLISGTPEKVIGMTS
jgi:hypothetical protein